jgi:hypothetical protein
LAFWRAMFQLFLLPSSWFDPSNEFLCLWKIQVCYNTLIFKCYSFCVLLLKQKLGLKV